MTYQRLLDQRRAPSAWSPTPGAAGSPPDGAPHRVPLVRPVALRAAIGFALLCLSFVTAARLTGTGPVAWETIALVAVVAWLPAVWLTDKYRHKYPQRYDTYLLASHLKAGTIMAVVVAVLPLVAAHLAPAGLVWPATALFLAVDYLCSLPRRRIMRPAPRQIVLQARPGASAGPALADPDAAGVRVHLDRLASGALGQFIRESLPDTRGSNDAIAVLDDLGPHLPARSDLALLIGQVPLNQVNRLNLFIGHCAERVMLGGYLAVSYTPLDAALDDLRRRYPGVLYRPAYLLHFFWYRAIPKLPWLDRLYFSPAFAWLDKLVVRVGARRNRVLPKAEVWGRLAFWGFEVVTESEGAPERYILARRVSAPVANRRPSYYAVVALEKVGLDGELIRLHKVRSMYPFSEFLQRRLYEAHGLTATGKFRNDFRLTEYGKLIRRHWIDELPGLYDWLRGDIKLVGMRATSQQFLSTYPQELYDLYVQIKPGLIPPIFDESTGGFDAIVATELAYLQRYRQAPILTDIAYFWYTFRDIVFRKVRSH